MLYLVPPAHSGTVPQVVSYQGYLTDAVGNPVGGVVQMIFVLYTSPEGPASVWDETHTAVTVHSGVYSVMLGSVDPSGNPLLPAYFAQPLWLGVTVGADDEMTPRQALSSVPYALQAEHAETASDSDTVDGAHAADFSTAGHEHDARYFTESELSADGGGGQVHWGNLTGVPAGFADEVDDDTHLSETEVDDYVANNGYLTGYDETDPTVAASVKDGVAWGELSGVPADFADEVDNDTHLSEAEVDAFVDNNGYLTGYDETDPTVTASVKDGVSWGELSGVPPDFADEVDNDTHLSEAEVDAFVDNNGYLMDVPGMVTGGHVQDFSLTDVDISENASISGSKLASDGSVVKSLAGGDNVSVVDHSDGSWTIHSSTGSDWGLTGNTGTNPAVNFLGTTDNQALEIRVYDMRALRLEPHLTSPNFIAGYSGNSVTAGVVGSTIGGGGESASENLVTDNYGTVGGGKGNVAGDEDGTNIDASHATVGGGRENVAQGMYATIGGGWGNMVVANNATIGGGGIYDLGASDANRVTDDYGTVGGGTNNQAGNQFGDTRDAMYATVGGGAHNTASEDGATVGGGNLNTASGVSATIGGGSANQVTAWFGTIAGGGETELGNLALGNRVTDMWGTVGGGGNNQAGDNSETTYADFATVSGGSSNIAAANYATIGGGLSNQVIAGYGTIGGGGEATEGNPSTANRVTDKFGTIGGGGGNQAGDDAGTTDDATYATVGGGYGNKAYGAYATIGGGSSNQVWVRYGTIAGGGESNPGYFYTRNRVTDDYGTIGGGGGNQAGDNAGTTDDADFATVGGGIGNEASGSLSSVGGGGTNAASGYSASIGGGYGSHATESYATIAGGAWNYASGEGSSIGGGNANFATEYFSSVSGGKGNEASARYATVPGGLSAKASHYGQMAYGSGDFEVQGDAQTSVYVLRNVTDSATKTELFLDGLSERILIEPSQAISFEILVVARSHWMGYSAGYRIFGVLENDAGTLKMVGASGLVLGEDVPAWDAIAEADDVNDALAIKVTGDATNVIRWVATVRTSEAAWFTP